MKTKWIIAGIIAAFIVMITMCFASTHNRAISLEEQVFDTQSDVQVQEKRRNDLIYNLADCVKAYDKHEATVLIGVAEARRTGQGQPQIEGNVSAYLSGVAEAYPQLKSNENYRELMNELAMTENKIAESRSCYNKQVRSYNKYVRRFPHKQILNVMGYEVIDYSYLEYDEAERQPVKGLFEDVDR